MTNELFRKALEADWENDTFREAFEEAKKPDKFRDDEELMVAAEYFKNGWEAALSVQPVAQDFDTWSENPYTKALQKSVAEDYVPKCDVANRLRVLSEEMINLGIDMEYYGGFSEISAYGKRLIVAAHSAESLANWIDAEIVTEEQTK